MTNNNGQKTFTPAHHGLLMAWMGRHLFQRVGPVKGEMHLRKAIRRYGEERGRRMALRAQADGKELTMLNYLIYGECSINTGEMTQKTEQNNHNNMRMMVERCPWQAAWMQDELVEFGRYYCQEIDLALVRGFNPDLHLDVLKTQTNDRQPCDFIFHGAPLTVSNSVALMVGQKLSPGKRALLPWEYHVGHLYKAFSDVFTAELGLTGREAAEAALADFAARFGEDAAQIVRDYQSTDFISLPEKTGLKKLEPTHGTT